MKKKEIGFNLCVVPILLLLVIITIPITESSAQWMSRSLLSNNLGEEGVINFGKTSGCNYPNLWNFPVNNWAAATAGDWYGRKPVENSTLAEAAKGFHNSHGTGIWILSPKIGNKSNVITWTGPGLLNEGDNVRIFYDPRINEEINLGYTVSEVTELEGRQIGITSPDYYPFLGNWIKGERYFNKFWQPILDASINQAPNVHIGNYRFNKYSKAVPSPNTARHWPEEINVSKWVNKVTGIEVTEKVYGYSYQDFDDFNIFELTFTNTGDTTGNGETDIVRTLDELYFSIMQALKVGSMGDNWRSYEFQNNELASLDDWFKYSDDPSNPDPILNGYKVSFQYDGDDESTKEWDDTGEPYIREKSADGTNIGQSENMLQSPQYIGLAPIAYTNKGGKFQFSSSDINKYVEPTGEQPVGEHWWSIYGPTDSDVPDFANKSIEEMYNLVSPKTIDANPTMVGLNWNSQLYGPYKLKHGESAKIVFAIVGGTAAQIQGESDIVKWSRKAKVEDLPLGKEALKQNIDAAQFAYDNNYDVPKSPPDVRLFVDSTPKTAPTGIETNGNNTLWWTSADNATNPDYTANDVIGYRVYRSTFMGGGDYHLIADIKINATPSDTGSVVYAYSQDSGPNGEDYYLVDLDSKEGFNYYYSVRAYAEGHSAAQWVGLPEHIKKSVEKGLEAGLASPLQRTYGIQRPIKTVDSFDPYVIPNPYISDDPNHSFDGEHVDFRQLPPVCDIYIFTASGDLVQFLEHNDYTSTTHTFNFNTWNLVTKITSGIYYWVIESKTPGSIGEIRRGTLAIVR